MAKTDTASPPAGNRVYLGDVLKTGFDYGGFAEAIKTEAGLTAEQKDLALRLFNPTHTVQLKEGAFYDLTLAMFRSFTQAPSVSSLEDNHPTQQIWNDVWHMVQNHYQQEISDYSAKQPAASSAAERNTFPFARQPSLYVTFSPDFQPPIAGANSNKWEIYVSETFLALPPRQQTAFLIHEAAHFHEPVLNENYARARQGSARAKRGLEYKADQLAVTLGYGVDLKEALGTVEQAITDHYQGAQTIYNLATAHGFEFASRTFDRLLRDAARTASNTKGNPSLKQYAFDAIDLDMQNAKRELRSIAAGRRIDHDTVIGRLASTHPTNQRRGDKIDRQMTSHQELLPVAAGAAISSTQTESASHAPETTWARKISNRPERHYTCEGLNSGWPPHLPGNNSGRGGRG